MCLLLQANQKRQKNPYLFYFVNVLNRRKLFGVYVFSDYWCVFGKIFLYEMKYVYKAGIRLWVNTKETCVKVVDVSCIVPEVCEVGCRRTSSLHKKGLSKGQEGHVLQRWKACTGRVGVENYLQEVRPVLYCNAVSMFFFLWVVDLSVSRCVWIE